MKDAERWTWSAYTYQVVIVGAGFLADAYDLFVIDLVLSILHRLHPGGLESHAKSVIASATLVGAIFGQLTFGVLGDWIGRRWTFLATCFLIVAGAVMSGCVTWAEEGAMFGLVQQLALCRFLLGVGVGGEYPLAATIAAEGAPPGERGRFIAAVFSMQGWGMLLSCLMVLMLLDVGAPLEVVWRTVLIFGAIPSAAVIFIRSKMEETEMYKETHSEQRVPLSAHFREACGHIRQYWKPLVGTTMTWLLLDVTFYGTGSFKHRVSNSLQPGGVPGTAREEVWDEAVFATLCSCMAIPGYLLSVAFIDRLGRYNVQLWGFVAMAINFFAVAYLLGLDLPPSARWSMLMCFGFTFLFSNFGPNTTTFMLPAEVYPTMVRATCHGLSAAAGKLGAAIGTVAFSPCEEAFGIQVVLAGCGVVCLTGAAFTMGFTADAVDDLRELDRLVPPGGLDA
eukprot:CAMPEP_0176034632 /NCGR_PEP_ID=MMETSP0120_2-20121206/17121_1 /TAXON_ID=160619 /ORGANISM="Kryptoperidinium foliaceum, Strain CCMP 1326" /LENGTH=450 /DNA_ID=CAMNT_0017367975 /DNA_START=67 /DNA_END=1415 /DNA_ORIENTATION=+